MVRVCLINTGGGDQVPTEAVRALRDTTADPEFGPWLAQASILVVDDEPGMRNFLMRTLGPRCKLLELAADTREASLKLDLGVPSPFAKATGDKLLRSE